MNECIFLLPRLRHIVAVRRYSQHVRRSHLFQDDLEVEYHQKLCVGLISTKFSSRVKYDTFGYNFGEGCFVSG